MVARKSLLVLSSPQQVDLALYKGDTGKFRLTFTDEDGAPINVSTATWDADIRVDPEDAASVASFTVTPVGGDTSSVDVTLSAATSAGLVVQPLVYDIQMTLSGIVTTLMYGSFIVTQDVSRT